MEILISSLLEIGKGLWGLASKPLGYIYNLKDNVRSLNKANEDLKAVSEDVKARVEREEEARARRTHQVANWLVDVQEFVGAVDQVLREAEERDPIRRLCHCLPQNCRSSYRLGKRVDEMLKKARDLQKKGEVGVLTLPLPPPPVIGMPLGKTVGLDTSLNKVWKCLVDEKQGGVIGLYGLGGVGKTTLMKKVNEKISCENPEFKVVIWVVVSRQVSEEAIRDTIRKRLSIEDQIWSGWSPEEKVHHLCQALTKKKFVLLIDDLWARLDLSKIGVPNELQNGSKIVFTTREKQICAQMGAQKTSFEVRCLTSKEALELFERNAGESTVKSHPEIQELANKIVDKCKGLPLALITVGQAMAGIDNPSEWKHALKTLRRRPHGLQGMEEVYHVLEFSYNRLNDSTLQRCFLYCCLFPEDYRMRPRDLIGLWIGERLLSGTHDVYNLWIEGETVLGRLNRACLLESGHDYDVEEEAYVKMHDVIRDMAMWIARDHGKKENKWLVIEREANLSAEMISEWRDTEKVSIWGHRIVIDQIPPRFSQLETLIVRKTLMDHVPRGFFDSMVARLMVLDLSKNRHIKSLPEDVCTLINLEYLNLSNTSIQELPSDIDKLTHLQWLLLDSIFRDILISIGAIKSLPLNVLSMWHSGSKKEEEMVEELGHMQHPADLSITVCKSSSVKKIFQSLNLQRSMRRVEIRDCPDLMRIVISHSLLHLESLILWNCPELVQMEISEGIGRAPNCSCFPSLTYISIYECGLLDLSWLVHAPKLQELKVQDCPSLEKIIGDGFASGELAASKLFSRLEVVWLYNLPKLTSICDEALSFPQGVRFYIGKCRGLRKLPLDSSSARGGSFSVSRDKDWWAGFEWDPAAGVTFRLEEMTYGEARRRIMEDEPVGLLVNMRFLPHGPSE